MKNVVFIPNIDLGNDRSKPYEYSIKSWRKFCDKYDCELLVLDEFVLILVSAPVMLLIWSIFSDDPDIMMKVDMFFEKFNNMPFWYQALFIGVVSAIYGLKGADIIKRK